MGRRRSDQSAMSPAFNPHPPVRRGAMPSRVRRPVGLFSFNPHPPVRRGAIYAGGGMTQGPRSFQSSPPREEGCYPGGGQEPAERG